MGIEAQPERCCRLLATSRRLPTRASVERDPTESSYDSVIFSRVVAQCLGGQFRSEYVRDTFYPFVLFFFLNARQAEREGKRKRKREKGAIDSPAEKKKKRTVIVIFLFNIFVKILRPCRRRLRIFPFARESREP